MTLFCKSSMMTLFCRCNNFQSNLGCCKDCSNIQTAAIFRHVADETDTLLMGREWRWSHGVEGAGREDTAHIDKPTEKKCRICKLDEESSWLLGSTKFRGMLKQENQASYSNFSSHFSSHRYHLHKNCEYNICLHISWESTMFANWGISI